MSTLTRQTLPIIFTGDLMNNKFNSHIDNILKYDFNKTVSNATAKELLYSIGKAYNSYCLELYEQTEEKRACYFSAEFLIGKLTKSNLFNSGLLEDTQEYLQKFGRSTNEFENFDDPALGNGGLGRLAACFLDSAASCNIPLDGYGIRYKYGYFKQSFKENKQIESADNWQSFYDGFAIKENDKTVKINFGKTSVNAVPYVYLIPGFNCKRLNKLVLFEAAPINEFDYSLFDKGEYEKAFLEKTEAEILTASLYPNDNFYKGKRLRLMQQYFFSSASLYYIIENIVASGKKLDKIEEFISIQLNDTHPVVAVPEFIRIMLDFGKSFDFALEKARKIFAYTNHTVLAEALEKWDVSLFKEVLPQVYEIILLLEKSLEKQLNNKVPDNMKICDGKHIYMANIACYISKSINGVAAIHSEIIKENTLHFWYAMYPEKFNNKTNGVTQRRWLFLANPELYSVLKEITDGKIDNDFKSIKILENFKDDKIMLDRLYAIRQKNKIKLCKYIFENEGIQLDPDSVFDVQIKRLHEYKRQLMNIFAVISIYLSIKEGTLIDFPKTVFLFGAKSAPGYHIAKRIIEFINTVAQKINQDDSINNIVKVVFVSNYNVGYAEKIIPAADISEQISLAGKEASGTGNMKFMMNGAVTLGTLDGANIEIVEKAGSENNYIFGMTEDEVKAHTANYDPEKEYCSDGETRRVVDTLINRTFCKKENTFKDIYDDLLKNDRYFVLKDLRSYTSAKIKAIKDTYNKYYFMRKCLINTANSYEFSSDRTVKEYAEEIWFKEAF